MLCIDFVKAVLSYALDTAFYVSRRCHGVGLVVPAPGCLLGKDKHILKEELQSEKTTTIGVAGTMYGADLIAGDGVGG